MLDKYNLTMLTDFYELTMANGYFRSEVRDYEASICSSAKFRITADMRSWRDLSRSSSILRA